MKDVGKIIKQFDQLYGDLNGESIARLNSLYSEEITFTDPFHAVYGLDSLKAYFHHVIKGVDYCRFSFSEWAGEGEGLFISWQMRFRHPKLAKGCELVVPGVSHLKLRSEKVFSQVDYYDAGSMLYEHIPLLGAVINRVKTRVKAS